MTRPSKKDVAIIITILNKLRYQKYTMKGSRINIDRDDKTSETNVIHT